MNYLISARNSTVNRLNESYWKIAFSVLLVSFYLPIGSGAVRSVFYLLIFIPALISVRKSDFRDLSHSPLMAALLVLAAYVLIRSADFDVFVDSVKSLCAVFALVLAGRRLPVLSVADLRKYSEVLMAVIVFYVFANASLQYIEGAWVPGARLNPLFGQSESVIFLSCLMASALVVFAWACVQLGSYMRMLLLTAFCFAVAVFFLQSRSFFPVLIGGYFFLFIRFRKLIKLDYGFLLLVLALISLLILALYQFGVLQGLLVRGDSYRFEIWSGYHAFVTECGALFGCGWGDKVGYIANDGASISHPHSMYVQHYYWGGVIGLILTVVVIFMTLLQGYRHSLYLTWPLLAGAIALAFDGKGLITQPNERWFLVLVPMTLLIGALSRAQGERSCRKSEGAPLRRTFQGGSPPA